MLPGLTIIDAHQGQLPDSRYASAQRSTGAARHSARHALDAARAHRRGRGRGRTGGTARHS